ncbi:hypothetical protein AB395_00002172 [Sinorhizobium fredii CCBAU 45436]|nr:hypothetical protein SF83666_c21630 [Sinorhizobium fredii CCBAU 83666]AWI57825.1 hypothetical protein AB395_00002172 [Sinorhizobium fredii CCBAU 45436]AWM25670.1 hypothetical protein AOX55_00002419 [Sinorhizobium fredii CCBAU 25509]
MCVVAVVVDESMSALLRSKPDWIRLQRSASNRTRKGSL